MNHYVRSVFRAFQIFLWRIAFGFLGIRHLAAGNRLLSRVDLFLVEILVALVDDAAEFGVDRFLEKILQGLLCQFVKPLVNPLAFADEVFYVFAPDVLCHGFFKQ